MVAKRCRKKRKEKMMPAYKYWHEYEHVGFTLITVFRDAMYGVMPPLPRDQMQVQVFDLEVNLAA